MNRFALIDQEISVRPPPLAAAVWGARDASRRVTGVLNGNTFRAAPGSSAPNSGTLAAEVTLPSGAAVHYAYKTSSIDTLSEKIGADLKDRFAKLGWMKFWGVEPLSQDLHRGDGNIQLLRIDNANSKEWTVVPASSISATASNRVVEASLDCVCVGVAQTAGTDVAITVLPQLFDDDHKIGFAVANGRPSQHGKTFPQLMFGNDLEAVFWHYRSHGDALSSKIIGRELLEQASESLASAKMLNARSLISLCAFGIELASVDELKQVIKVFGARVNPVREWDILSSLLELKLALAEDEYRLSDAVVHRCAFNLESKPWLAWLVKDCSEIMAELRDADAPQSSIGRNWLSRYGNWAMNLRSVSSQIYIVDGRRGNGSLGNILTEVKKKLRIRAESAQRNEQADGQSLTTRSHKRQALGGEIPTSLRHYDVIRKPIITEKATSLAQHNKVLFEVAPKATKPEIKAAVEALFRVKVASVNTAVRKGKLKTFRGLTSRQVDVKKATVTLKPGYSIDVMGGV